MNQLPIHRESFLILPIQLLPIFTFEASKQPIIFNTHDQVFYDHFSVFSMECQKFPVMTYFMAWIKSINHQGMQSETQSAQCG